MTDDDAAARRAFRIRLGFFLITAGVTLAGGIAAGINLAARHDLGRRWPLLVPGAAWLVLFGVPYLAGWLPGLGKRS